MRKIKSPAQRPGKVTKYGESGGLQNTVLFSRRILRSSKIATMAIRQIQPTAAASSAAKVPAQPVRPKTGAVGDHPETQFGEAIADQIGEGALDSIGGADRFSVRNRRRRRRSTAADQTPEAQRKQRGQIDVLVAGVLVNPEGGDNQRQRDAGHQRGGRWPDPTASPTAACRPARRPQTG